MYFFDGDGVVFDGGHLCMVSLFDPMWVVDESVGTLIFDDQFFIEKIDGRLMTDDLICGHWFATTIFLSPWFEIFSSQD